ncbi:MAG: type I glyceraldehyde-3-phosphate dehydrogenase [Balneolales bacterium]
MASIKVGINGFGRIGRMVAQSIFKNHKDIQIVQVNDLTDAATLAHLFKYDSVHGRYQGEVRADGNNIIIDDTTVAVSSERDPANLDWAAAGVDVVVESTGFFTNQKDAEKHIQAGAKKVIISAPAKGDDVKTIVLGVNDEEINDSIQIYSNASCTTNCLAPMVKILDDSFGVEKGFMTTIHAYTGDQSTVDSPHKDLRRARAAAINMIPTTTGAAKAVGLVLPHLAGKLDGGAVRVPVADGSLTDFTAVIKKDATTDEVIQAFKTAAGSDLKGILEFTDEPIVSTDIVGNIHSCIFDSQITKADGKLVKVVGWYDNEAGYSARTADLIKKIL